MLRTVALFFVLACQAQLPPAAASAPVVDHCAEQVKTVAQLDDAYRRYGAGRALAQSGVDKDVKASVDVFSKLAIDHPWFKSALRALGIAHGLRGNWVASYTAYVRYLDGDVQLADRQSVSSELRNLENKQAALSKFAMGASWLRAREWSKAVAELREAIDSKPQFALAYLYLGRAYEGMNQPKDARAAFKEYLERDPFAPDRAQVAALLGAR